VSKRRRSREQEDEEEDEEKKRARVSKGQALGTMRIRLAMVLDY
jgi:hypothetical protein